MPMTQESDYYESESEDYFQFNHDGLFEEKAKDYFQFIQEDGFSDSKENGANTDDTSNGHAYEEEFLNTKPKSREKSINS
jgi:hypothetical protein